MRLLDLYCCAGGAAAGYHAAGFEIVGVDSKPQPRYPYAFIQADVLSLDERFLRSFDAIHASPPCQFGTALRHAPGTKKDHLNLIPATRTMLQKSGRPYVIENVEAVGPHLVNPIRLCGSMFHLGAWAADQFYQLQRHRLFECSFPVVAPDCDRGSPIVGIYGGHVRCRSAKHGGRRTRDFEGIDKVTLAKEATGIAWATMNEMSQAVPPAYTQFIGLVLASHLSRRVAA